MREGTDVTLISTGVQTSRTLQAAGLLAAVVGTPAAITVEEHTVLGGLGSLVSELFAEHGAAIPLSRIGLADEWSESAPNDFLLDKHGLSPERVCEQVLARVQ